MTRLFIASVAAIGIGAALQAWTRPSVEDLEVEATIAWNKGDEETAEHLARAILARDPQSQHAQEVMQQLAFHTPRPALVIALEALRTSESDVVSRSLRIGDAAMSQNMLRVAESFWQEGLKSDPSHEGLRARLITLAGIRLDPQGMLHQLLEVPKDVALNEQQVLLCLSGFAIDTHGVLPVEEQLRWSLEADSEDMKTRVGLARALMILGRHSECLSLLEDSHEDAAAVTLRALVRLNRHELVADSILPEHPPADSAADFYQAHAVKHSLEGNAEAELASWRMAVRQSPLSSPLRAFFCDALRRQQKESELQLEATRLAQVRRIGEIASSKDAELNAATIALLTQLCHAVDADEAVELLTRVRHSSRQPL